MANGSRLQPTPALSRAEMETLQCEVADAAVFEDDCDVSPDAVRDGETLVAGVDQAFLTNEPDRREGSERESGSEHDERYANQEPERALSAVVVLRGEEVVHLRREEGNRSRSGARGGAGPSRPGCGRGR